MDLHLCTQKHVGWAILIYVIHRKFRQLVTSAVLEELFTHIWLRESTEFKFHLLEVLLTIREHTSSSRQATLNDQEK